MKKILKFLPELIVLLVFVFLYAPYLSFINLTIIHFDSYVYLLMAKDIFEGNLPLSDNYVFGFFPYGQASFMSLIYKLGGSIDTVVTIQIIISLLSAIFLVNQAKKIDYKVGVALSVVIGFYCSLSESMYWNVALLTESLFLSCVMLITGVLFSLVSGITTKKLWLFSAILLITLFIRSNAIVFTIIPFVIVLLNWKSNRDIVKTQIGLIIGVFLCVSAGNYFVKGFFFPMETKRLEFIFTSLVDNLDREEKNDTKEEIQPLQSSSVNKNLVVTQEGDRTYIDQAFDVYTNLANAKMGDFYYYRLKFAFPNLGKDSMTVFLNNNRYLDGYTKVAPDHNEYIDFVYKNFSLANKNVNEVKDVLNIEKRPRHPWIYSVHLVHLLRHILKNWVTCLLFYVLLVLSLLKNWKLGFLSKERTDYWRHILVLGIIYLICLAPIVVAGGPNDPAFTYSLSRYSIVFEPFALLSIILGVFQLLSDRKRLKRTDNFDPENKVINEKI